MAKTLRLLVWLMTALACDASAQAQGPIEFNGGANDARSYRHYRFDGTYIIEDIKTDSWSGTQRIAVRDLDLSGNPAQVWDGGKAVQFRCKPGLECVEEVGVGPQFTTMDVDCPSASECQALAKAVHDAIMALSQPAARTNPPTQARANPASPSSSSAAAGAPDTAFHDMADEIRRRNGGTTTLDDLAKKTKPTPTPPRPAAQPTYVAFAQSAGFDANSQYGYARNKDLNSAIGQANSLCVSNAQTSCGDEGYCMLQPGLYGAWVSDRKYLGAKAFACNLKTEEEAVNRAMAWCGSDQCQLLWTGAGN